MRGGCSLTQAFTMSWTAVATGYSYSHTKNVCEWLTTQRKAIRKGKPRAHTPTYAGAVDYFGGLRID